ncbi:MAG: cell envelope integrity protein TolA [Thermomonas sp.]
MKETRADTRLALLQAAGLHVVLFALMFAGLFWTRSNVVEPSQGEVIEADLIDPSALSASMRRALQRDPKPLPEPVVAPTPEPLPPDPEPLPEPVADAMPPPVAEPDKVDQEKVQRDAIAPDPAQVAREQEAKRREQQADLDAEREKQLAEIRRQREKASREVTQAEMRAQQLADAKAQQEQTRAPPPGNPDSRSGLKAVYGVAITTAVERQWIRPESIRAGERCQVLIIQIPGGEVIEAQVSRNCPFDALGRRSLEAAIMKASPLPYAGFEDVFERRLSLWFERSD